MAWFAAGGDLRARNAGSSWLGCAGVVCGLAEGMRMSAWRYWYGRLWCGVCSCMLYVLRDLRSGDDGDHSGGGAGDQETAVAQALLARPTGVSATQIRPARAPPLIIFDACATLSRLASHRDPCSLTQLNLHSNTSFTRLISTDNISGRSSK